MLRTIGYHPPARFEREGDLSGLTEAIMASETGVGAISPEHADRAETLLGLATYVGQLYQRSQEDPCIAISQSLNISLETWQCDMSPPLARMDAVYLEVKNLSSASMLGEGSALLGDAGQLLPSVTPQYLMRVDQDHRLSLLSSLAAHAGSIALQAGSTPAYCLCLLELTRSLIISLAIDFRNELSELRTKYSTAFERFNRLRIEIDTPLATNDLRTGLDASGFHGILYNRDSRWGTEHTESTVERSRHRRVQAIHDMNETVAYICKLQGFKAFQLPPSSDSLITMAAECLIIIFNTTNLRSDAVIVTSSVIKSLTLPHLKSTEANVQMTALARQFQRRRSTYVARNREMGKILLWRWEVAVDPVLNELQSTAVSDGNFPRVSWIGVGLLGREPFHAAGDHSTGSTCNTICRVISSSIPTIKALAYARKRKLDILERSSGPPRLLLIAMPTTPDTPAIPDAPAKPDTAVILGTPGTPATSTTPSVPRTPGVPATYRTMVIPGAPAKVWPALKNVTKEVDQIMDVVKLNCFVVHYLSLSSFVSYVCVRVRPCRNVTFYLSSMQITKM